MGFKKAVEQWKLRVQYNFALGTDIGSDKSEQDKQFNSYSKPAFYSPGAEATSYETVHSSDISKIVYYRDATSDTIRCENRIVPKPQRRWDIFVNFFPVFAAIEVLSWVVVLLFQTGKFVFYTGLWVGAKNIVGPFVLSLLGVLIIPFFNSVLDTLEKLYCAVGTAQDISSGKYEQKKQKRPFQEPAKQGPSGFWGWVTFLILLPVGMIVGAARGVMRTVLMLCSEVDDALGELFIAMGFGKKYWLMLPQLFNAIGDWFETLGNHLSNIVGLVLGNASVGSFVKEAIEFIFNLPARGFKLVEMVAVRLAGLVLALVADLFVFWSWMPKAQKIETSRIQIVHGPKWDCVWLWELWRLYLEELRAVVKAVFGVSSSSSSERSYDHSGQTQDGQMTDVLMDGDENAHHGSTSRQHGSASKRDDSLGRGDSPAVSEVDTDEEHQTQGVRRSVMRSIGVGGVPVLVGSGTDNPLSDEFDVNKFFDTQQQPARRFASFGLPRGSSSTPGVPASGGNVLYHPEPASPRAFVVDDDGWRLQPAPLLSLGGDLPGLFGDDVPAAEPLSRWKSRHPGATSGAQSYSYSGHRTMMPPPSGAREGNSRQQTGSSREGGATGELGRLIGGSRASTGK